MQMPTEFLTAYIVAALWSSHDDNGDFLDTQHDASDLAPETLAQMESDCRAFWAANHAAIQCERGPLGPLGSSQIEMAGHDFWLTRCGHGAGFWDGDWPEPHATTLDNAAQAFGVCELYVGDNGLIYA